MDRLTKWLDNRKALCIEVCEKECTEGYYECHDCKPFTDVMKKLAEYEDLEEQGLLLKLPCKVGTKLYFVGEHANGKREILSVTVNSVMDSLSYKDNLGKGIYLTKAEAEKALAEMEK